MLIIDTFRLILFLQKPAGFSKAGGVRPMILHRKMTAHTLAT